MNELFNENIINCKLDDLINKNIYVLLLEIQNQLAVYEEKILKNIAASNVSIRVNIKFLLRHIKPYVVADMGSQFFNDLFNAADSKSIKDLENIIDKINIWFFNKKSRVIL